MRVSPCGIAAGSLDEALSLAESSAAVTHDHPEGVKGAKATAAAVYLARTGADKPAIRRYIEENYPTGSLTEIAETLHYDLCWLSREIKRRTGKTFKELLQEKRLTQAAYFLKHTSLHVDEIGTAVGYSNLSYFHRIFAVRFGMTPKKYRDSCAVSANGGS